MLGRLHLLLNRRNQYIIIISLVLIICGIGFLVLRQISNAGRTATQAAVDSEVSKQDSSMAAEGQPANEPSTNPEKETTTQKPTDAGASQPKPGSTTASNTINPISPLASNPTSPPASQSANPNTNGSSSTTTSPTTACSGSAWSPGSTDPWGGCWPGPDNTGVPSGVVLSSYTGPCAITADNTVIDAKTVNCVLSVRAANVQITRSQINGGVDVPSTASSNASFAISDSSIFIGDNLNTGLMRRNFTANRVDIVGGRRSVYCASNCTVENSWVHAQGGDPDGAAHFSGVRMEQYTTYRHNSITCEATRVPGSGCSAGLTGYGDFAPIQNNLIEKNLFYRGANGGSTACAYGGSSGDDGGKPYGNQAMNIRFIGNRFVRSENGLCGNLRTIIDFNPSRPGNVWTDNSYHDGGKIAPTGP